MPHLSSMGNQKLYRIVIDVQYGDMLDECNKLYDGEGYGTVFTDANGDAVIDYLKQWIVMNGLTMIFAAKNQGG